MAGGTLGVFPARSREDGDAAEERRNVARMSLTLLVEVDLSGTWLVRLCRAGHVTPRKQIKPNGRARTPRSPSAAAIKGAPHAAICDSLLSTYQNRWLMKMPEMWGCVVW